MILARTNSKQPYQETAYHHLERNWDAGKETIPVTETSETMKKSSSQSDTNELLQQNRPKDFAFPKISFGQKKKDFRAFLGKLFDQNEWLRYNEEEDKAFCYPCMKAYQRNMITSKKVDLAFMSEGYKN